MMDALEEYALVLRCDSRGNILYASQKFCELSQYSQSELIGASYEIIASGAHSSSFFSELLQTISLGNVWKGVICNRSKGGAVFWVQATIVPEKSKDGAIVGYVAFADDITSHKINSVLRKAQLEALEAIALGSNLENASEHILRELNNIDPALKLLTLELSEGKNLRNVASVGLSQQYREAIEMLEAGPELSSCGAAGCNGKPVFVDNIQEHPHWTDYKEIAAQSGLNACWSMPILSMDNDKAVMGTFAMYADRARSISDAEKTLLIKTAEAFSVLFFVHRERRFYHKQNEKLANIINTSPICIHELDLEGRFISINRSGMKMMGEKTDEKILGLQYFCLPDTVERKELLAQLFAEARDGKESYFEYKANIKGEDHFF